MRTDRRFTCTLAGIIVAGALLSSGCGAESERNERRASPGTPAPLPAPTENPLTSDAARGIAASVGDEGSPGSTRVEVDGVAFTVPGAWVREAATSTMRAAQYLIRAPEGVDAGPASFVVFRRIGGTAEANILRWIGQITDKPEPPRRDRTRSGDGLVISTVRMTGTYSVGPMMGGTGHPEPDTMFLGAVIEGAGDYPVFFRLTGPRATVERHLAAWDGVLASVARAPSEGP